MERWKFVRLALLLTILLIGAFLRFARIDTLPPSAGYDQAAYGVDALHILQGERPLFIPTNIGGREVLFSYFVAAAFLLLGPLPAAIYLTSAVIGLLTIPLVYHMTNTLLADEELHLAQWGGIVAAACMAFCYWHLSWSRLGMRVILTPLATALTVDLAWQALRTDKRLPAIGAGLTLGLSMYTYQASRLMPALFLWIVLLHSINRPHQLKNHLRQTVLTLSIAILVFAPLAGYFLTHPGEANRRVEQVMLIDPDQPWQANLTQLTQHTLDTLNTLFIQGNSDPRVDFPGRPILNIVLLIALILGILLALRHIRRPLPLTLLGWLVLMSLPTFLAGYAPPGKRALGAAPSACVLIAIALLHLARQINRLSHSRLLGSVVPTLALLYTLGKTTHDYFIVWGTDPDLFYHFESGVQAIGTAIAQRPPEEPIYLSPVPFDHPSLQLTSNLRPGVKTYKGAFCLVLPNPSPHGATYILTAEDTQSIPALQQYATGGAIIGAGPFYRGTPYFTIYHLPPDSQRLITPTHLLEAYWQDNIRLLGYDLTSPSPNTTLNLTLYYNANANVSNSYIAFVQLIGPPNPTTNSPVWAQYDSEPCGKQYPTSQWSTDEIIIDRIALPLPTDLPHTTYELIVGFYSWPSLERLLLIDRNGAPIGDHLQLTTLTLGSP